MFSLDSLVLQEVNVYFDVLHKNLLNVVNYIKQRRPQNEETKCQNCFHTCSASHYRKHHASCLKTETATIEMTPEKKIVVSQNFCACAHLPPMGFFDLEPTKNPTTTIVKIGRNHNKSFREI